MIKTTKLVYYLLKNHTLTPLEIYSIDTYILAKNWYFDSALGFSNEKSVFKEEKWP